MYICIYVYIYICIYIYIYVCIYIYICVCSVDVLAQGCVLSRLAQALPPQRTPGTCAYNNLALSKARRSLTRSSDYGL